MALGMALRTACNLSQFGGYPNCKMLHLSHCAPASSHPRSKVLDRSQDTNAMNKALHTGQNPSRRKATRSEASCNGGFDCMRCRQWVVGAYKIFFDF